MEKSSHLGEEEILIEMTQDQEDLNRIMIVMEEDLLREEILEVMILESQGLKDLVKIDLGQIDRGQILESQKNGKKQEHLVGISLENHQNLLKMM